MEEWDIYDKYRIKKGKVVTRGDTLNADEFHLVIHVAIINSNNQLLIQQRQPFKKGWPNLWDITVGGTAQAGETSQQAAERELFEELGYAFDFTTIRPHFTINFQRGFDDYYILKAEVDLTKLTLQETEVQNVKWAYKDEIVTLIQSKQFIPYHFSVIDMIFDMKDQLGIFSS
ncbi:isopentenyl-diphosphate Delta-isomerase [Kordia sp. SMS9]|uniref:NUDIX hydrolase n=1 Tax=Kordia sp. SMS9 TaxID=2282170 RepID=UPI000E0CD1AB|nr:NUDIX domain-containing protein [Kordia sp. SMS9]AXG68350.1 isopentenyl-diphosphate Delta-isomerase [Kordia sp. SMS9]